MVDQPSPPSLQAIPEVSNSLQGLYDTVSALVQNVRGLSGQTPRQSGPSPKNPSQPKTKQGTKKDTSSRFTEVNRKTETVKIMTPDDATQYVIVTPISSLTMQDAVTGETWTWTL